MPQRTSGPVSARTRYEFLPDSTPHLSRCRELRSIGPELECHELETMALNGDPSGDIHWPRQSLHTSSTIGTRAPPH